MKTNSSKILILLLVIFTSSCNQDKSPFYDEILKSEKGHLRGVEIGTSIEEVKSIENGAFLKDKMPDYLHYDYEISMGNGYTVTYDFSEENKLYEIEIAIFLDVIEDADLLFNNFSNHFKNKFKNGKKEDDGYMTWHTSSTISGNRVAISMINDSETYGYLTILVRDLDY